MQCKRGTKTREGTAGADTDPATENTEIEDGEDAKTDTETEETDEAGDIQKELAKIEEQSIGYENADWSSMGQADMNQTTAQHSGISSGMMN